MVCRGRVRRLALARIRSAAIVSAESKVGRLESLILVGMVVMTAVAGLVVG